jgi:hypothetical protein
MTKDLNFTSEYSSLINRWRNSSDAKFIEIHKIKVLKNYGEFGNQFVCSAIEGGMMRCLSAPTLPIGDENPGGTTCRGLGLGLGGYAISSVNPSGRGSKNSHQTIPTMGETEWNVGHIAKHEVGGPFSPDHAFGTVIVGGFGPSSSKK